MSENPSEKKLENKVALITGAGRGIGRSIAEKYAQEGADLFLNATRMETLEETKSLVSKYGIKIELCRLLVRLRRLRMRGKVGMNGRYLTI